MRGGFLHNHILLDPIEEHFHQLGAHTRREFPIGPGACHGFVDLWIHCGEHTIACEAELTPDRVAGDLRKAQVLQASLLLIVVPHRRTAQAVTRRFRRTHAASSDMEVWILPLGPALERLRRCFPLISTTNGPRETNNKCPMGVESSDG